MNYEVIPMAVYAVKVGKKTGKFYNWTECSKSVWGFSGAVFKKFATEEEADAYLGNLKPKKGTALTAVSLDEKKQNTVSSTIEGRDYDWVSLENMSEGEAIAYVDGSYLPQYRAYGFSCVYTQVNKPKFVFSGSDNNKELLEMRNITGEMIAAMAAVIYAKKNGANHLTIVHDYEGLSKWATGEWAAKRDVTQAYTRFMQYHMRDLSVHFVKVKGHSGLAGNNLADKKAKGAIQNKLIYDSTKFFKGFYDFTHQGMEAIPTLQRV